MSERSSFLSRHKTFLLGAACGIAVLGAVAVIQPGFTTPTAANAQITQSLSAQPGFANLVDAVKPAVVAVKVKTREKVERMSDEGDDFGLPGLPQDNPMQRWFRQFGPGQGQGMRPRGPRFGMSQGSGFFISADGYIVTNNHVVENATEVDVVLDGGKTYTAKVIGTDPKTDLALIKITEGSNFPFVQLSAAAPRVGDWVIAVGNPFGLGGTVTAGIVSARGRDIGSGPYDDFLQIDAAVNRGNSGGPTFDLEGNVVGVNTAIFSPSGGNVGIAFAIPSETVKQVVDELKADGKVTRGWIGVRIQPVTPEIADSIGLPKAQGAIIADASADGPAAKFGLEAGDTITAVNGKAIEGPRDLARVIAGIEPGKSADITYWRDGKEKSVSIKLGTLPNDPQQASANPQPDDNPTNEPTTLSALGLTLAPASETAGAGDKGVVVTDIDPDSKAADQLRAGDVILKIGSTEVDSTKDVTAAIKAVKTDGKKSVLMLVKNGETTRFVALPVG